MSNVAAESDLNNGVGFKSYYLSYIPAHNFSKKVKVTTKNYTENDIIIRIMKFQGILIKISRISMLYIKKYFSTLHIDQVFNFQLQHILIIQVFITDLWHHGKLKQYVIFF